MAEIQNLLDVELIYIPSVNFAMQQNYIPVIRKILIKNNSENDLCNIKVEIFSEPDFAITWNKKIDLIPKNENFDIGIVNLQISTKYLSELTEKIAGSLSLIITSENQVLYKERYNIDILAYDQWSGVSVLPEILSAFVTPNHPEVPKIIKRASAILEKWTGSPSFDEYQTRNPDRVKKQMAAIYEAIAEKQIIYCSVPASFEESGQRIRTADVIMAQQIGNCLDLSLLYASCLEAIGIHSLIVIIKGHAFAGGWLIKESFSDSVNDDPSLLTKRIADGINEITVVEATCMNTAQKTTFDDALKCANGHLIKGDEFVFFIDVKRSRFSGIRPLPLRIHTTDGWDIVEDKFTDRNNDVPTEIAEGIKLVDVEAIDVSKQRLWERKLLDLSLRNNLLNLRVSKGTVQFISVALGKLEDGLASGDEFQILSKPADWDNPLRNAGVYQSINQSDPIIDLVKNELSQKRLRSYYSENDLNASLTHLYRSSKLALEENGANTLYVALGMLKWYETNTSERPRYAPLLLLPVEIIRKSAQKGYVIRSREEETMLNITLLEMLRQDFGINIGGLEVLPKDDSGVDVKLIFNIIRQSIMSKSRWDVEEQAFLGNFSFSKFIMWNDIHSNADKLSKNKIVASLISGKIEWAVKENITGVNNLDKSYHPSDIALPISADSSQLEAICAAMEDNSFILHGPPGTGKSQTITNIIANALYKGKKVLFVAEKMAALSVVQSRLEAIGLNSFCLELHSNKSKKSIVLEQLKAATEVTKKLPQQEFISEAERLNQIRAELNDYVEALHKVYPFGVSLYEAFTGYSRFMNTPDKILFNDQAIESLSREQITLWDDTVEELQAAGTICIHPYEHTLREIQVRQYTLTLKGEAKETLDAYLKALIELKERLANVTKILNIKADINGIRQLQDLKELCKLIITLPDMPSSFFTINNIEETTDQIIETAKHGTKRDELRNLLINDYNSSILTFEAEKNLIEWRLASQKWLLPKFIRQNAIVKLLGSYTAKGKIDKSDVIDTLEKLINYQKEQKILATNATFLSDHLGRSYQNGDCNWDKIVVACDAIVKLNKQAINLLQSATEVRDWRGIMANEVSAGTQTYVSIHRTSLNSYIAIYDKIISLEITLKEKLEIDFSKIDNLDGNRIENSIQHAQRWHENIEGLKDWITWLRIREKAINGGLLTVVDAYENGAVRSNEVNDCYKKGLYRSFAEYIFKKEPGLASFNGLLFEDKIKKFRQVSKIFEQLTKEELFARLAAKIPSFTQEASQSSEIGILQKAIRNGARGMSIRKLFDSIPNLLPRLCPCMLMSPISVAQYFDAGTTKFDLVVFDEASQMPTCEAIGAIARGTNVIVVGDPKQMPPTSFFSSQNIDEDNIEKEDLESILDDCLALSMPSNYLLWHYRSKHESLIAFSNSKYYDNKLLTFPSPDDITSKVKLIPVEGYYDKGKTKQNVSEAKAIVEEIIMRLSDPVLSKRSIGVVTFSSVQQTLIDDMLTEVFRTHPEIEAKILQSAEPLFVKNLENVQGDERDVILFSVGYGPDKEGKVSLNFGPLNRSGGWRRLNVAVSRARYEMKVFSTLRADQIDMNRTSAEGVAGLKAFLEYAEKGKAILEYRNPNKIVRSGGLTELVADEIRKLGYDVNTNIGCSGYKIDIGVVDPKKPSEYILAILCDGYNYKEAKTARDREIVQVDVLKLLGWNIHKIWSTEWWENADNVIQNIIKAIKDIENKITVDDEEEIIIPRAIEIEQLVLNNTILANNVTVTPSAQNKNVIDYEVCTVEIVRTTSSDDFLLPYNQQKICDQIIKVIEVEAPISKNLLCKRVLSAWGISRAGIRIAAQFDTLFKRLNLLQTGKGDHIVFWRADQHPQTYNLYRVHKSDLHKRDADDLPPEEVANAMKEILMNQISLPKDALIRESARTFGFTRIGSNVELSMNKGIQSALTKGYAIEENDRIIFNEKLN